MHARCFVEVSDAVAQRQLDAGKPARMVQPEPASAEIITLRELAERLLRVHVDVYLKSGSAVTYRSLLAGEILPALGDRDFRSIKRADIQELHATMKGRPGAANNMIGVISSLYTRIIEDWELSDMRNPAQGVRHFAMQKRNRFLTPEERQRVHAVIQAGLQIPAEGFRR